MKQREKVCFKLQFDPSDIEKWALRYPGIEKDETALAAGQRLAAGQYKRTDFEGVFGWKSKRPLRHIINVDDADLEDALRLAIKAKTDRASVAVLTGITGVSVPMASAVLAMMLPKRFTVIDFRALQSLGLRRDTPKTIQTYLQYNDFCRKLAVAHNCDLRTLDRALWAYAKHNAKHNLPK